MKMPYKIVKKGSGFAVKNMESGKEYSKKPMTKKNAEEQKRLLEIVEKKKKKETKRKPNSKSTYKKKWVVWLILYITIICLKRIKMKPLKSRNPRVRNLNGTIWNYLELFGTIGTIFYIQSV